MFDHPPPALLRLLPERLRILPYAAVLVICIVVLANIVLWLAIVPVLVEHPSLSGTAVLAYTLGLRHALDADHISAIDLMTRKLVYSTSNDCYEAARAAASRDEPEVPASAVRKRAYPATVGTWFSLGHSTIVVITCVVVAATSGELEKHFDGWSKVGGVIGTSVSAAVLILLGMGNAWILWRIVKRMQRLLQRPTMGGEEAAARADDRAPMEMASGGLLLKIIQRVFKLIDRPWKMYPLGVLFGLGFDTSSEIAVLGIASIEGAKGTSIWLILIFPLLFTAGMCMVDTTDGALMMSLYTSTSFARDEIAVLYYSIVLTAITVLVAMFVGTVQLLSLVAHFAHGNFWQRVDAVGEHYDAIGGAICGVFVVGGALAVVVYDPWRRWVEPRRLLPLDPHDPSLPPPELGTSEPAGDHKPPELQRMEIVKLDQADVSGRAM